MLKKLVSWILICIIIIGSQINTQASEVEFVQLVERDIDSIVVDTTLSWLEMLEPELNFEIGDIHKVIEASSGEIQYTVAVFVKSVPYGYTVVCFENEEAIIKESCIGPGTEGLYTDLIEVVDDSSDIPSRELKVESELVEMAPMQYCVVTSHAKNKKAFDNYGNEYNGELIVASTTYNNEKSIYITPDEWKKGFKEIESSKVVLNKHEKRQHCITQEFVIGSVNKYSCGVQALYNIAYKEGLVNIITADTCKKEYPKIWDYTDTRAINSFTHDLYGKVVEGENEFDKLISGFVKYAKEKGYTKTVKKPIVTKPSVTWIKSKLMGDWPIIMGYWINVGGRGEMGHAIVVLGYMKAKRNVSTAYTWDYLMVCDGWNAKVRYINYSTVDFVDCEASYFILKK